MEFDIRKNQKNKNDDNLIEKVVHVNRVSKVVKGGRRFGTAALVVVGNGKGKAGFGNGKAKELQQKLQNRGILVRYFDLPFWRDGIRISVGKPEHTDALIKALQEIGEEINV